MKSTSENDDLERYFYTVDEQGSTDLITSNAANICNEYYYDAFGNILERKESVHNRITYTGQQYDQSTNQYYLRARFYNPTIGRFIQEDIYRGDGLNLYDYCRSNPVRYYDPSGYESDLFTGMTNEEKGKLGEKVADHIMKKKGYKKYPSKVGSNNGFDGVYIKFDKKGNVGDIVINESKFGGSRLSKASVGNKVKVKQMSTRWINGNLDKMSSKKADKYVQKTAKMIQDYIKDGNVVNKTLNRVRKPTKVLRKHPDNVWKNLGVYNGCVGKGKAIK